LSGTRPAWPAGQARGGDTVRLLIPIHQVARRSVVTRRGRAPHRVSPAGRA